MRFKVREVLFFDGSKLSRSESFSLISDIVEEFSHYGDVIAIVREDYFKIHVYISSLPVKGEFTIFARREISRITVSTFSLPEDILDEIEAKIIALATKYQLSRREVSP